MSAILVTGADGFVGSALTAALAARGIGARPAVRQARRAGQVGVGEIGAATRWEAHLAGCDAVVHLAARVHVMRERARDPLAQFRAMNVEATLNLARQAARCGVPRFVFVSSVKVNGEASGARPFRADDAPAPRDAYGVSKMEAEQALRGLAAETGIELAIVRPPLVYGPGVRANFRRLMQLVRMGWPLPFGAVDNRRSMVALDNLVDLLIACARQPAAAGRTFMVSDGEDVSSAELLRMLAAAMGRPSRLWRAPPALLAALAALCGQSAPAGRLLDSLQVDGGEARARLGWKPVVGMGRAIEQTVAHFLARP